MWAYGMCGDAPRRPLEEAVGRRRAAGDGRVRYVPLRDCDGNVGARSHPSRHAHARAAGEIVAAIESAWNGEWE